MKISFTFRYYEAQIKFRGFYLRQQNKGNNNQIN